jgi:hypothetical protein
VAADAYYTAARFERGLCEGRMPPLGRHNYCDSQGLPSIED